MTHILCRLTKSCGQSHLIPRMSWFACWQACHLWLCSMTWQLCFWAGDWGLRLDELRQHTPAGKDFCPACVSHRCTDWAANALDIMASDPAEGCIMLYRQDISPDDASMPHFQLYVDVCNSLDWMFRSDKVQLLTKTSHHGACVYLQGEIGPYCCMPASIWFVFVFTHLVIDVSRYAQEGATMLWNSRYFLYCCTPLLTCCSPL